MSRSAQGYRIWVGLPGFSQPCRPAPAPFGMCLKKRTPPAQKQEESIGVITAATGGRDASASQVPAASYLAAAGECRRTESPTSFQWSAPPTHAGRAATGAIHTGRPTDGIQMPAAEPASAARPRAPLIPAP